MPSLSGLPSSPSCAGRRPSRRTSIPFRAALGVGAVLFAAGCELSESTLTEPQDLVVLESYLTVRGNSTDFFAFLHRTIQPGDDDRGVREAWIVAHSESGARARFQRATPFRCLGAGFGQDLDRELGTCYVAVLEPGSPEFEPGDRITMEVETQEGEQLTAFSQVPADFSMENPRRGGVCRVDPDTSVRLRWSSSEGTWAYVAETLIFDIKAALEPLGIVLESDPIYLLGLSVAADDTDIVFPAEFGVFDRFDLDRDLALVLQRGLPRGTSAVVSVAAADRNSVNWARGGSFNPSGAVRIPSVFGDGTGVFGTAVQRSLEIRAATESEEPGLPACAVP